MMAKREDTALVRAFIEKMSGDILEDRYRPQLADLIRRNAGIYALYAGDTLYYVGLATDLMRRVDQHLKDHHAGEWDRFSVYLTERDEHIKPLESLLLRVFQPPGNGQRGKLPGAVDKKRLLETAMKRLDAEKRDAMLNKRRPANVRVPAARATPRKGASRSAKSADTPALARAIPLQAQYKGRRYQAVLNKDRSVRYAGQRYASLSASASAVTGSPTNGWHFWRYRDETGEWVSVNALR